MVNKEEGYFAIPYEIWDYSVTEDVITDGEDELYEEPAEPESSYDTGVLLFKAGDRIGKTDKHSLDSTMIFRSV